MKRLLLLPLCVPLLSILIYSQTPTPTATAPVTANNVQAVATPAQAVATSSGILPNLPALVEIFASAVMLASVLGALWSLRGTRRVVNGQVTYDAKKLINPRHIQFISVGLIVPTILILGLEKVLTSETSATLIGGLAGYLLSGIGKYEPPHDGGDKNKASDKDNPPVGGAGKDKGSDSDRVKEEFIQAAKAG